MSNNSKLNENFSRAMAYYKALTGKNNKDIANALHLPATTISSWNTGRHLPDMDRLQRLSNYLHAPLDQFFEFSLDKVQIKENTDLHNRLDTDEELLQFIKLFIQLSDEDRKSLMMLVIRIVK